MLPRAVARGDVNSVTPRHVAPNMQLRTF